MAAQNLSELGILRSDNFANALDDCTPGYECTECECIPEPDCIQCDCSGEPGSEC